MTTPVHSDGAPPPGLLEAFWAYEHALMADDVAALDRLFLDAPTTLRGDAAGLLVGHAEISEFRGARGGAPPRRVVEVHVQPVGGTHALVVAVTELERGGWGQQTQLWGRGEQGWQVQAAHVSVPAPALDTRVWRVVGDPLVAGRPGGPLDGETVAVKDLYAVAGHAIGGGNPVWEADQPVQHEHAWAVERLLGAGASVRGIARTDELAYSLAGTNAHTGTPPNPRAPRRVPGGSSSGSASAVALGHASIGLGTDTGGSVRVPAAYQGLYGIRTTHGVVPRHGLVPLARSFDAVGWLTRSPELLVRVGESLLPPAEPAGRAPAEVVCVPALLELAEPPVREAVQRLADRLSAVREDWPLEEHGAWLGAFQTWQAWEAWQAHGSWLGQRLHVLGPDVRQRFERAATLDESTALAAQEVVLAAGERIRALLGERVLVLPSASSTAPRLGAGLATRLQQVRETTMRLTCLAGLGGLPAVAVPVTTADRLPAGACLVGPPGSDRALLRRATEAPVRPTEA